MGFANTYRSTSTAVLCLSEFIHKALNNKEYVVGIFTDIKKAFDTVNHNILLSKLDRYGFRGPAKQFFSSYLSGRKQCVKIGKSVSSVHSILCGVCPRAQYWDHYSSPYI